MEPRQMETKRQMQRELVRRIGVVAVIGGVCCVLLTQVIHQGGWFALVTGILLIVLVSAVFSMGLLLALLSFAPHAHVSKRNSWWHLEKDLELPESKDG